MLVLSNTPVDRYSYGGTTYYVKREDLACAAPGPPFAKIRGLFPHLLSLQARGVKEVGYVDTAISMAGWGISYLCRHLGMTAVVYYPKYKDGYRHNQKEYVARWQEFGAIIVPLTHPTKLQINMHVAKRTFTEDYPKGVWLENGLRLSETVAAVEEEYVLTTKSIHPKSIVCSVGSGVMLAGIIRGVLASTKSISGMYGVLVNKYSVPHKKRKDIFVFARVYDDLFTPLGFQLHLVNPGYAYEDVVVPNAPFPCNPYYDMKAYAWMLDNINKLPQPILFWNIGA
jgi:threonine dehydratase